MINQSANYATNGSGSAKLYLPHLQPKLLGSARGDGSRNHQLLTALNKSYDSASSQGGGSAAKGSPRVGTSPTGLRPVLQQSRLTESTAPSMSNQRAARNGFAPYKYKVSVQDIVAVGNKTDNTFVLPGYHDKLPAPFTPKDKP